MVIAVINTADSPHGRHGPPGSAHRPGRGIWAMSRTSGRRPRDRDRGDDPAARRLWGAGSAAFCDLHDLPEFFSQAITANTVLGPVAVEGSHYDIFLVFGI